MGSVRNPIGPLPSSIYWRRRAVVLCLVALLAVLIAWAVNSGGSSGGTGAQGPGGHTPATSITPGPTPSGSHNSGRPGGRDTGGASGSGGSSDGTSSGGSSGSPSGGTDSGVSGGGSNGAASGGAASGGTGGSGGQLPAGSTLADCAASGVQLTLRTTKNSYAPGEKPKFELTAANSAAAACKLDFGSMAAVVAITDTTGNKHVWATDDCPAGRGAYLLQVPAHGSTTYTIEWNRQTSSPDCATPKGQQAAVGTTYLVEAKLQGFTPKQASFVLKAD